MSIEEYFGDWSRVVDLDEAMRITKWLVNSRQSICPDIKDVFKAFRLCPLSNLRAIVLSQDPYPQKGVATGIAFANTPDTPEKDYSPSLRVLMESVIDFTVPHKFIKFDPSLEEWEKQGVLMLNSALSCKMGYIGSHTLLWRPFIKSLLTNLSEQTVGIVYVLMGSNAQTFEPYINKQFNHVFSTKHPSYYARTKTSMPSDIWRDINNVLVGLNGYGIEWYQEVNI